MSLTYIKKIYLRISIGLALIMSACTQQSGLQTLPPVQQTKQAMNNFLTTGKWQQIPSSKRTQTATYIATEGFYIPPDLSSENLLATELQQFIRSYNIKQTDTVLIDGLRNIQGKPTKSSKKAIQHLQFVLRDLGFQSKEASKAIAILDPTQHNAALLIHRKIIVVPDCHTAPLPKGARPNKRTFGCVQEINLANMVVSPEALDGTQSMSSADSTTLAAGVDRYRKGEVKALISNLSTSGI
ncbi:CpaD family pilus assembly lipoprotein [Kiloniella majae]|uniref:CpaD family pilus assembly lipoprotein n=1 Tax=Kiloniella majae TaxID=1938558 RepID=UPI0015C4FB01|nr:CpaD family pilus assembly lipoprotein [Kiloniella majae]